MTRSADPPAASAAELAAMRCALVLAATPGVPRGPNPRVGCVLLDEQGERIAEGHHRGAGTPHAEIDALTAAGKRARGATAVVTLEPCNHTGRTGPCSEALVAAGVEVVAGVLADAAEAVNHAWTFATEHDRPLVTWKVASTLDGRMAAADGTSQWITGPEARAEVHDLRATVDAVIVGTGTVLADDPALTVRHPDGSLRAEQPLRVVIGRRPIPDQARVRDGSAPLLVLAGATPAAALAELAQRGVQHALLESGPTLATAFLRAGLVDEVRWYSAPLLLGAGRAVVGDLDVATLAAAQPLTVVSSSRVGADVRIDLRMGGQ